MSVAADPGWTVLAERHPPDACASTPFVPKGVRTVATAVAPAPRVRSLVFPLPQEGRSECERARSATRGGLLRTACIPRAYGATPFLRKGMFAACSATHGTQLACPDPAAESTVGMTAPPE